MCASEPIHQAVVFGEGRPWNVAVVAAADGADKHEEIDNGIRKANLNLPPYAQISRWLLADEDFSPRNGMLTMNGRYRRDVIYERYKDRIAACYEERP